MSLRGVGIRLSIVDAIFLFPPARLPLPLESEMNERSQIRLVTIPKNVNAALCLTYFLYFSY